jgi:hypothetical protein
LARSASNSFIVIWSTMLPERLPSVGGVSVGVVEPVGLLLSRIAEISSVKLSSFSSFG